MSLRRIPAFVSLLVLAATGLLLTSCLDNSSSDSFQLEPVFGNNTKDGSPVIVTVDDIEITERDLDIHLTGLPDRVKRRFMGEDGKKLLVHAMVDQVLFAKGAAELELHQDPEVAAALITMRREAMVSAMRNLALLKDKMPTEEELRQYFVNNKENYRKLELLLTRHIECFTKEDAEKAYRQIVDGGPKSQFPFVVSGMSVNQITKKREGNTGWFSRGGMIPEYSDGMQYSEAVFDLTIGLHPPMQIAGRWHVVEVLDREEERYQTFAEARDTALNNMKPAFQDAIIKDYLRQARKDYKVVYKGTLGPGNGMTPQQLFDRAMVVKDPEHKMKLLELIFIDYPENEKADDALFLCGNIALINWQDHAVGSRYLTMLLKDYPESELVEDTQTMLDNLYNPEFWNLKTIENIQNGK